MWWRWLTDWHHRSYNFVQLITLVFIGNEVVVVDYSKAVVCTVSVVVVEAVVDTLAGIVVAVRMEVVDIVVVSPEFVEVAAGIAVGLA